MTNGLGKGSLLVLIISLYWKKDFQESTPKIQMLMFGLTQSSYFGLWDIIPSPPPPPPRVPTSFSHILCKKNGNTHTCKRISWNSGGNDVLKIFFYFLYV